MAGKLPYLPLFTGDWVKDPELTLCTPATRGIWIDLLCAMHERGRCGELLGTVDQLARFARCTAAELALALDDLHTTGAAVVQKRDGSIFVRNRRMYDESQKRKSNAERQKRHREVCRNVESNSEIAIEYESDNEPESKRFIPPTIQEVTAYCLERKNKVNPEQFMDYYTANGWVQGRQGKPLKDWRAAVRTWEKNNFGDANGKPRASGRVGPGQIFTGTETDY
jgi:hypothetical protein